MSQLVTEALPSLQLKVPENACADTLRRIRVVDK
jgi:hypothetical protein